MDKNQAISFFRQLGISIDKQHEPLLLLRAARRYIKEINHTNIKYAKKMVNDAFTSLMGLSIQEFANKYDNTRYDEGEKALMPRKLSNREAMADANMVSADELFHITMLEDEDVITINVTPDGDIEGDFTIGNDWFANSSQEFLDRATMGEPMDQLIYDLSLRFASFFDGDIQAFEFATCAFTRKANALNIPLTEAIYYNGNKVPLHKHGRHKLMVRSSLT